MDSYYNDKGKEEVKQRGDKGDFIKSFSHRLDRLSKDFDEAISEYSSSGRGSDSESTLKGDDENDGVYCNSKDSRYSSGVSLYSLREEEWVNLLDMHNKYEERRGYHEGCPFPVKQDFCVKLSRPAASVLDARNGDAECVLYTQELLEEAANLLALKKYHKIRQIKMKESPVDVVGKVVNKEGSICHGDTPCRLLDLIQKGDQLAANLPVDNVRRVCEESPKTEINQGTCLPKKLGEHSNGGRLYSNVRSNVPEKVASSSCSQELASFYDSCPTLKAELHKRLAGESDRKSREYYEIFLGLAEGRNKKKPRRNKKERTNLDSIYETCSELDEKEFYKTYLEFEEQAPPVKSDDCWESIFYRTYSPIRAYFSRKRRPTSLPEDDLRQRMYSEYMGKVAERMERRQNKEIRITETMPNMVKIFPKSERSLEEEFMQKARTRLCKLGIDLEEEESTEEESRSTATPVEQLPEHLKEFVNLDECRVLTNKICSETRQITIKDNPGSEDETVGVFETSSLEGTEISKGVWSSSQSYSELERTQSVGDKGTDSTCTTSTKGDDQPVIWTPRSAPASPTTEKKTYKPVKFESPVLKRKNVTFKTPESKDENVTKFKPVSNGKIVNSNGCLLASKSKRNSNSQTSSFIPVPVNGRSTPEKSINLLKTPKSFIEGSNKDDRDGAIHSCNLPKVQNPTITLLQKAREGQLPRGALYLDQEEMNRVDEKTNSTKETVHMNGCREGDFDYGGVPMHELGPRITPDLSSNESQTELNKQQKWYKKMYESLHKSHDERDYVTVTYKKPKGPNSNFQNGYQSEPDNASYDPRSGPKWSTFRHLPQQEKENHHRPHYGTVPRSNSVKCQNVYKNEPGRIEDYTPGRSSLANQEEKRFWDEVMDIFEENSIERSRTRMSPMKPLHCGYESDSTLVFKRRGDSQRLSPAEQHMAYKTIQNGGEVPFNGLRKMAPEKPKADPFVEYFPISPHLTRIRIHRRNARVEGWRRSLSAPAPPVRLSSRFNTFPGRDRERHRPLEVGLKSPGVMRQILIRTKLSERGKKWLKSAFCSKKSTTVGYSKRCRSSEHLDVRVPCYVTHKRPVSESRFIREEEFPPAPDQSILSSYESVERMSRRCKSLSAINLEQILEHDYHSYVVELLRSTSGLKSPRFLELSDFYRTLERKGRLERVALGTKVRSGERMIDYERWKRLREKERAEEELEAVYRKLKRDQESKDLLFSTSDVDKIRWNSMKDRGLRIKEKSVEDLRKRFAEGGKSSNGGVGQTDLYKPLWRACSVLDSAARYVGGQDCRWKGERTCRSHSKCKGLGEVGAKVWSSLSMEQLGTLKTELNDIYGLSTTTTEEKSSAGYLRVRSHSLVDKEELYAPSTTKGRRRMESNKSYSIAGAGTFLEEFRESEKKRICQQLGREFSVGRGRRSKSASSLVVPRETMGAIAVASSKERSKSNESPRTPNAVRVSERQQIFKMGDQFSTSENDKEVVEYYEDSSSSECIIHVRPAMTADAAWIRKNPLLYKSSSLSDFKEMFGERFSQGWDSYSPATSSPDPPQYYRAYTRMVEREEGDHSRKIMQEEESLMKRYRSDPEVARVIFRNFPRSCSPVVAKLPFKVKDRFMPHINVISKQASLMTPPPDGNVDRLRERYERMSLMGQMYTSSPDIRELGNISPYLECEWVAHKFPEPVPARPVAPDARSVHKQLHRPKSVSPIRSHHSILKKNDVLLGKKLDARAHIPICRYRPGWEPTVSFKKSPRKYAESEVTLQYKIPVRNEIKETWSQEELARRQEETMRRIYQEERRRKYVQELQDMSNRRHFDNFTPSQKSPISLNRYNDIAEEPASHSRSRTPEPKLVARALFNFTGQSSKELTFRKGDIIFVKRQIDRNWYEGERSGSIGLFPINYVEIIPYEGVRTVPKRPSEGQARVKFNFIPHTNLELPLVKGELIVLTRRVDQNWYEGRLGNNRTGIFPVSYVQVLSEPGGQPGSHLLQNVKPVAAPAAHSLICHQPSVHHSYQPNSYAPTTFPRSSKSRYDNSAPLNQTLHVDTSSEPIPYRALYNYKPQNEDELELKEGDTVYVMEKCDDGWYVGSSHRTAYFGTFPGNYVQRISQ